MSTKRWVITGIVFVILLIGCRPESPERPNVLFIIVDQFRPDISGALGGGKNISTPNIDKLANSGIVFDNAVSTVPVCTPFRGMVMTGNYPTHTGIVVNFVNATTDYYDHTIGELFNNAGYKTGFIGKWHLGAGGWTNFGDEPRGILGIDRINNFIEPGPGRLGFDDYWAAYNFHMTFNDYYFWEDEEDSVQTSEYETDVQVDQAIKFMGEQTGNNDPFFLVLSTHPPHPPFSEEATPAGYLEQIPDSIIWDPNVPEDNPQSVEAMRSYLAMAKNVDDNIGRILSFLEKSGLDKNTIVVFTSDHGEMHGSHGYLHKQKPYREALNVPVIYRITESQSEGIHKEVPFTPMDHLPTLCRLVGIELPDGKDGIDLSRVIKSDTVDFGRPVLIGNYVSNYNTFSTRKPFLEWRGVYTGQFTYVRWIDGEEDLYENDVDPYQLNNLIGSESHESVTSEMRLKLRELLKDADDEFLPGTAYASWFDESRYPKMEVIFKK